MITCVANSAVSSHHFYHFYYYLYTISTIPAAHRRHADYHILQEAGTGITVEHGFYTVRFHLPFPLPHSMGGLACLPAVSTPWEEQMPATKVPCHLRSVSGMQACRYLFLPAGYSPVRVSGTRSTCLPPACHFFFTTCLDFSVPGTTGFLPLGFPASPAWVQILGFCISPAFHLPVSTVVPGTPGCGWVGTFPAADRCFCLQVPAMECRLPACLGSIGLGSPDYRTPTAFLLCLPPQISTWVFQVLPRLLHYCLHSGIFSHHLRFILHQILPLEFWSGLEYHLQASLPYTTPGMITSGCFYLLLHVLPRTCHLPGMLGYLPAWVEVPACHLLPGFYCLEGSLSCWVGMLVGNFYHLHRAGISDACRLLFVSTRAACSLCLLCSPAVSSRYSRLTSDGGRWARPPAILPGATCLEPGRMGACLPAAGSSGRRCLHCSFWCTSVLLGVLGFWVHTGGLPTCHLPAMIPFSAVAHSRVLGERGCRCRTLRARVCALHAGTEHALRNVERARTGLQTRAPAAGAQTRGIVPLAPCV